MAEGKRENFVEISLDEYEELKAQIPDPDAVSYTHLTLPTKA